MAADPPSFDRDGAESGAWEEAPSPNGFTDLFGPLARRRMDDGWVYGMRARDGHRNGAGVMHGGAMAAFIDETVGTIARDATGRRHVTVQMSTTFLKPVAIGDFVELACEIVKVTRSMTFVEAKLSVAGAVVATASLILKARTA